MLKRVGERKWVVMSADGKKRLSKPVSRAAAAKRLKQVDTYKSKSGY